MNTRLFQLMAACLLSAAPAAAAPGAPVQFDGKTLLTIQAPVGSFSPAARAQAIGERLQKLSEDPFAKIDPLTITESEFSSDINAGDVPIVAITEADARAAGKPRQALAAEYAKILQAALRQSRHEHSFQQTVIAVGLALLFTAILAAVLRLLQIAFARLRLRLEAWRGTRIQAVRLQKLELLTAQRVVWMLSSLATAAHAALALVALYFYASLVLSVFPSTRAVSAALFSYLNAGLSAAGGAVAGYTPNFLIIILIAVLTRYALKLCRYLFDGIQSGMLSIPGFYREWAGPTYKIARLLVLAIAAAVVFPYIPGHDAPGLRGISLFFGLLFSLGSASAVGNLVAGVLLTYTRAFQAGDRVQIADTLGDVTETTLLATHIRTVKNEDITVPNSLVLASHIVNFSSCCRGGALILHTSVTIGYDAPWRDVHQFLISAALSTTHILADPAPFVLQTALDDFYVKYQINAYTSQAREMVNIYGELHQNIQDKFNAAGVEICSPHFSALRDGNRIAIPGDYLPKTYKAPGFRVFSPSHGAAGAGDGAQFGS